MNMEEEDDLILVIVDNENGENVTNQCPIVSIKREIKEESESNFSIEDIIERVEKHGQFIKLEETEEYKCEYLEDEDIPKEKYEIKVECVSESDEDNTSLKSEDLPMCEAYLIEKPSKTNTTDNYRRKLLKAKDQTSFVEELREKNPHLRDDEKLLINTLCTIMLNQKPPPLPEDCYRERQGKFKCTICNAIKLTNTAAQRHYYEMHGPRYLTCFACGVDFRSKGNLCKHEKRCNALDADLVLKARALTLNSKNILQKDKRTKFRCSLCSAVFRAKVSLLAHESMHRGERPFQCHICPAAYTSAANLNRHVKKHSGRKYMCDHCGRGYTQKEGLIYHIETHNPDSSAKYSCDFCDRRFTTKTSKKEHMQTVHLKLPPPFACEICQTRFRRMAAYRKHMKSKHGCQIVTKRMFLTMLPMMAESEFKQAAKVVFNTDAK